MPQGRKRNIVGEGKDVSKRGEDLGTGPVGKQGGYAGRPTAKPQGSSQHSSSSQGQQKRDDVRESVSFRRSTTGGKGDTFQTGQQTERGYTGGGYSGNRGGLFGGKFFRYLIIALIIYFVISFVFGNLFPGSGNQPNNNNNGGNDQPVTPGSQSEIEIPFNYNTVTETINASTISGGWSQNNNSGKLDNTVAKGARDSSPRSPETAGIR